MEAGFLLGNKSSKAKLNKKVIGDSNKKVAPLLSDLARKVYNIEGKMLGKDGNLGKTSQQFSKLAVALPKDAIDEINARFVNTLYGFPVGKRLAFPMVENYVKHAWTKFGLKRVMMHHGSFMFQFESQTGMEKVLESGPWRIMLVPLILKVWMTNTLIQKESVSKVPLWVKMHNVPILSYSKVDEVWAVKRIRMMHACVPSLVSVESQTGIEKVMEGGPWRIQLVHFILKVWMPHSLIQKENVSNVPLWVKMHNVPIVAYSMVGLDLISAKVGRLMRLDAHTKFICLNSWERSEYARALVEVSAEKPLVDLVNIDIPLEDGKGYTTVNIRIEYEWQPPRCDACKNFDHLESVCPKKLMAGPSKKSDMQADVKKDKRPVQATCKKNKGKQVSTQRYIKGYRVNIPKTKLVYRAV
ncbi:chaperone protein DnaJ C76, chloroplastic, partial [Tanacetum coccineum]